QPRVHTYWSPSAAAAAAASRRNEEITDHEALSGTRDLLTDAVLRRTIADVPLGALLSGGIDSTLVVALMQANSTSKVQTFTIGFHEAGYDEAAMARAIARHLGTDHTDLYVTEREAQATISNLPVVYDEPFADPSQIPTLLLCDLARRKVVVALSGDGGDEL